MLASIPEAQQIAIQDVRSDDPNDIEGPQGVGSQGFISAGETLPYLIEFTNEASATAPAQTVTVTEQLSSNLNWNTFELGEIGFGAHRDPGPAGPHHVQHRSRNPLDRPGLRRMA